MIWSNNIAVVWKEVTVSTQECSGSGVELEQIESVFIMDALFCPQL